VTGSGAVGASGVVGPVEVDESALRSWAAEVGRASVHGGLFVCLHGPLGAGKSTFVRAACRGTGVRGPIPSPTFTLVNRHATSRGRSIWHADLYRLDAPDLLVDVGWPELVDSGDPVFVEWAERAEGWLPPDRWEVRLSFGSQPALRIVEIVSIGSAPRAPGPESVPC
jgi:tRNA threonylcarbamoyladenosine biosynthesis protein TsaE